MGTLFLVATPIGNLEDVTLRALRVLGEVSLIAAEDTRTVRKLLTRHGIRARRVISYTEHNRRERTPVILEALRTGDVVLVSEAGTPGVSDPGVHLVEAASAAGFPVSPVPGPSALTAALAVAGLPTQRFCYLGFLPRRRGERRRLLERAAAHSDTIVAFEAPHRLRASLADLLDTLGDRRVVVCRELTKVHEEVFRGTLAQALDHFHTPRGEFTIVVEGARPEQPAPEAVDDLLRELKAQGLRAREAVGLAAERTGLPRREVYRRWLALG
jgi:16S rRNA (cytidine1402-2'-O)-methyltransferase